MRENRKASAVHGTVDVSLVLGVWGLGQATLIADGLRSSSRIVSFARLTVAAWLWLLTEYGIRALHSPNAVIFADVNLLVRTALDLIRRAIEAIRGRSAEPVPVLVPIPVGAVRRPQKKLRSN